MARQKPERPVVVPMIMVLAGLALIFSAILMIMGAGPAGGAAGGEVANAGYNSTGSADFNNGPNADSNSLPIGQVTLAAVDLQGIPTPAITRVPYPNIVRISIEEAKSALDNGQAVFVDNRGEQYFLAGHIPGSLVMVGDGIPEEILALAKDTFIITYCTCLNEETSAIAAQVLLDNGYTRVVTLKGGLEAWVKAGYPIDVGNP